MYYFGVGLRDGLGVEGCGSQQHLICADAQSPPITLRAVASAALHRPQDLWRQIVWSPDGQRRVDLRIYSHMSTAGQSHMTECRLMSDKQSPVRHPPDADRSQNHPIARDPPPSGECCQALCLYRKRADIKLDIRIVLYNILPTHMCVCIYIYIYTVACESLGTPCRICENINNFNKTRGIIQNACYFLFRTVLSKIFYIKDVYI